MEYLVPLEGRINTRSAYCLLCVYAAGPSGGISTVGILFHTGQLEYCNLGFILVGILPVTAYYLPIKVTGRQDRFIKTTGGLLLFYGFMVYMIYSHYQSDYFVLMIICALVNLMGVGLVAYFRGDKVRTSTF